ncbi:hypothetical protein A2692_00140 [Candidatus Woesebacteria bacterium RIFCSPHIGHO2_01_FULL_39_95]|nr:MAG: hypothetical protein A2692_00140 [Candidatus Woesebacteria bacterium RIFCSPHIGHO2_01_FULL_39_95]
MSIHPRAKAHGFLEIFYKVRKFAISEKLQTATGLWSTATLRQSTLTSFSTIINAGLGALFYFFLAYSLGSHDYGIFTLLTTLIAMLASIADLGTDQGLVRYLPKYKNDFDAQKAIMKLSLKIKLLSGLVTFFALTIFARSISSSVFNRPDFTTFVPFVGLGVIAQLLFSYSTSLSQAMERFFLWSGLFIGTNSMRLFIAAAFFQLGFLNSTSASLVYIILPFLGFVTSLTFFDKKFMKVRGENRFLKELFGFNKWIFAFLVVSTVGSKLEIFFTTRFLGFSLLGIYGLIQQLSSILPQLTSAIGAVTSPKFASFDKNFKNKKYTLKVLLLTGTLGLISLLVMIPLGYLVLNTIGNDYITGFLPFIVLLIAMAIFLVTSPMRDSIIYYFEKPSFFFWLGIVHALAVTLLSISLIPRFDLMGTSYVVLSGQILIAISSVSYFVYLNKKN